MIPFDIIEIIMKVLADRLDVESLKACSLVSSPFYAICRKHIFSSIKLRSTERSSREPAASRFNRLLDSNPSIAGHVKTLTYVNHCEPGPPILQRLHSVTSFVFGFGDECHQQTWGTMPPFLRSSLSSFIQSNRIVCLVLIDIMNLPITIFYCFPHLFELHLGNVSIAAAPLPKDFCEPSRPPKLVIFGISICRSVNNSLVEMAKLLDPRNPGVTPILDLRGLEELYVVVEHLDDMDSVKHILRRSESLRFLNFSGPAAVLSFEGNLARHLTPRSLTTLKKIRVFPFLESLEDDPYLHLTKELEQMAGKNELETLIIRVSVAADSLCTTDASRWSQLDSVLSQPGSFPCLRLVKLKVTVVREYHEYEDFPARLEEIGRSHFPWLRANKQQEFRFEILFKDI
ncbi:hypothetical protein GALMADRAFT_70757 [Galerina marginata CBS 339.88]|uniref:F-box domain-containing protein n=1 Tax=Galerina marginata (strain CBS 339.88) TaxID=685588 RepID=A0A067STN8_GALM3|nr:hypothetical protein GALMADRAFT_70757 [Galerina marginata CBS 339.88]